MPDGASRLVSPHDPDARPIRKGRIGHPVEFGYKAQVADNPHGIVVDHTIMLANPPDAPLLVPRPRGSPPGPARCQGRSPPTVATVKPPLTGDWPTSVSPGSPFPAEVEPAWPARRSSEGGGFVGW